VSLWTGDGIVHNLPLNERLAPLFSNPRVRKITYDLKDAILKLQQRGIQIVPPYDDPLLMAYLLFPNRGKYELVDVVFDVFGQTVAAEDERTPWIDRLFKELAPRVEAESAKPYHDLELPLSPVLVEMESAGIRIDVPVLDRMSLEMGTQLDDLTR